MSDVGQCFDATPAIYGAHQLVCSLPHGHEGAHSDGQASWGRITAPVDRAVADAALALAETLIRNDPADWEPGEWDDPDEWRASARVMADQYIQLHAAHFGADRPHPIPSRGEQQ